MTEKVEVLYSCAYHAQQDHVSKKQDDVYQYPCTRNIGEANNITKTYWSTTNEKGHFGVPKLIFGRFGYGIYVDATGEYGMTQDCYGIVDNPENLEDIKQAMQSEAFKDIIEACNAGGLGENYNHKVISLFRKDFYKDFID
jgi:hypothetical protein